MNVTRITQLFSVQGGIQAQAQNQEANTVEQQPAPTNDAVTVSEGSDPAARAAKVAGLKEAVQNGSYNYNRPGVATALYRDLL